MAKYVPNLMKTINLQIKRIMNFKQIEYKSNHTKVHHYKVTEYQCVCVCGGWLLGNISHSENDESIILLGKAAESSFFLRVCCLVQVKSYFWTRIMKQTKKLSSCLRPLAPLSHWKLAAMHYDVFMGPQSSHRTACERRQP